MNLKKNQIISLHIDSLSSDGNGVGRFEGQAVFVPFSAPGDEAEVRIVKVCKTYAFGIIYQLHTPAPGRTAPGCPIFGRCGGCDFQHITYENELAAKTQFVADAMRRLGGITHPVEPCLPSPSPERYRNKVQYPLYEDETGAIRAGFYAGRSHRVIPCDDCLLQPSLLNEITRFACSLLTQFGVRAYDERTGTGFARHLYLRHAVTTGKVLVCLVANGRTFPQCEEFCRALTSAFAEIDSVVLNINEKNTNVVLGPECITLWGSGVLRDEMAGVPVALNPLSFYQVNTQGANLLYAKAAEFAQLTGSETLLDLYCGAGTIGLSMAHQCERLIGVEIVPEAIEDARRNAHRMGVQHAEFHCADAQKAAGMLAQEGLRPDVVIVDPPRKGCDNATLRAVLAMKPQRIVMISCNAATAARDAAFLTENHYEINIIQPVDLFPKTKHVECIVLLSRVQKQISINFKK